MKKWCVWCLFLTSCGDFAGFNPFKPASKQDVAKEGCSCDSCEDCPEGCSCEDGKEAGKGGSECGGGGCSHP